MGKVVNPGRDILNDPRDYSIHYIKLVNTVAKRTGESPMFDIKLVTNSASWLYMYYISLVFGRKRHR